MITKHTKEFYEKMFPGEEPEFSQTDPEFAEIFANFAFDEVAGRGKLDEKTRSLAVLAALMGCQGKEEYEKMLPAALNLGLTPVEVKEMVYQATAYLGIGRVYPFLKITNQVLTDRGVALPLTEQGTVDPMNRREKGTEAQVEIFGEGMKDFYKSGAEDRKQINYWLAENCFGDYYTRNGLDLKQREMITFCFLAAQGGCEPQLTSHAAGNMRIGNDKDFLIEIVTQCLPYIGYPRSLNALSCIDAAMKNM